MNCECEYCIYNSDFKCIIDEPKINSWGMCDSSIIISLDKGFLKKEKKRQLKEAESRWPKHK